MDYSLKDGRKLTLRKVRVEDAGDLLEYLKQVGGETEYLTFSAEGVGLSLEEERKFIQSKTDAENHLFVLAIVDEKIVGSMGLETPGRERISHNGEFGMSVLKEYWNCGIGGFMMDHMLNWARKRGSIRKINLNVRTDNIRAIKLYLKKGFSFEGCNRAFMKIGDRFFDVYYMGRELD